MSDTRTPLDLMRAYKQIPVEIWDEVSWQQGPVTHYVSLNTYLIGRWTKLRRGGRSVWVPRAQHKEKLNRTFMPWYRKHKDLKKKLTQLGGVWTEEDQKWYDANEGSLWRAANGKGFPEDIGIAMQWAASLGMIEEPITQTGLQRFCDRHLGLDCSGFLFCYFAAQGRLGPRDASTRDAASYFGHARARISSFGRIERGDVLVWMDGTQPRRDPGHAVIVESAMTSREGGEQLHVVEATRDVQAPRPGSPVNSRYRVLGNETRKGVTLFRVRRHGNLKATVAIVRPF
jgi:hypothetical protein